MRQLRQVRQGSETTAVAVVERDVRQGAYIGGPVAPSHHTASACPRSATATTHDCFALVLQAIPDPGGAPAIVRLRRFLKAALRAYRLRCVRCEPLPAEQDHDAEAKR